MLMETFDPSPLTGKSPVKKIVATRLRELKKSRMGLAEKVGKSLSYLSQIESGVTHFPEPMVEIYASYLGLNDADCGRFRHLVAVQNAERRMKSGSAIAMRIAAMLEARGGEVSDAALTQMLQILEVDLKERRTCSLRKGARGAGSGRMSPERFTHILKVVSEFRAPLSGEFDGLFPITEAIDHADAYLDDFDVQIVDSVPARFGDVWATVEIIGSFRALYLPEDFYKRAEKAASFERHVLAHELTHVILGHQGKRNFAPAGLSGSRSASLLRDDPIEELEANVGAVLMLLGWERLAKQLTPSQRTLIYDLHRIEREHAEPVYFFLQQDRVRELVSNVMGRG